MSSMKIVILGDSGVGKTSTIESFTLGEFSGGTRPTIGVEYKSKEMVINKVTVKIGLWDTAGQERFRSLPQNFYRDIHGAIIMYDVTNESSFTKLEQHIIELKNNVSMDEVVCLLVGNKIDKERKVTEVEAQAFAKKNDMMYMELSAKSQEGLLNAFQELVKKITAVSVGLDIGMDISGLVRHGSEILKSGLYNPNEKSAVVLREAYDNAQRVGGGFCNNNNFDFSGLSIFRKT